MKASLLLLLLGCCLFLSAQSDSTRIVKGHVYSKYDECLPGFNVMVKGKYIGTITDINGCFELEVPTGEEITLVVSAISEPVEFKLKPNKNFYSIRFPDRVRAKQRE